MIEEESAKIQLGIDGHESDVSVGKKGSHCLVLFSDYSLVRFEESEECKRASGWLCRVHGLVKVSRWSGSVPAIRIYMSCLVLYCLDRSCSTFLPVAAGVPVGRRAQKIYLKKR